MRRIGINVITLLVLAVAGALTFKSGGDSSSARPGIFPVAPTGSPPVIAARPGNDHAVIPAGVSTAGITTRACIVSEPRRAPAADDTSPARPATPPPPVPPLPVTLPLSVVASDQTQNLTPLQTTALSQLAEDFLTAVDHQEAEAPEPAKTPLTRREKDAWERERELNDARYLAQFGQEAFNAMLVRRAAAESGPPGAP